MRKVRVNTILSPETLKQVKDEAKDKSISVAAVIRQKVEASYKTSNSDWTATIQGIGTPLSWPQIGTILSEVKEDKDV